MAAESSASVQGGSQMTLSVPALQVVPHSGKYPDPDKSTVPHKLSQIVTQLEESYVLIPRKERARSYPRAVTLDIFTIHNNLVDLYTQWFKSQYFNFNRVPGLGAGNYEVHSALLARRYVSGWLLDLYHCLYVATKDVAGTVFNEKFTRSKYGYLSTDYDTYLATLNALIRPTILQGTIEETLIVPCFETHDFVTPGNTDPFGIGQAWTFDISMFNSILSILREKRIYSMAPLQTSCRFSRAAWMLEFWNDDKTIHVPFPTEYNLTFEDAVPIIILGGQLVLGRTAPVDVDDWQRFPNNTIPANINVSAYRRIQDRRFFGAVEERDIIAKVSNEPFVVEDEAATIAAAQAAAASGSAIATTTSTGSKRARTTPTGMPIIYKIEDSVPENLYQIRDFCYYSNLCDNIDAIYRYAHHRAMTVDITTHQ